MTLPLFIWTLIALRLLVLGLAARRGLAAVVPPRQHHAPDGFTWVVAPGAHVDDGDLLAACSHAAAEGLDIVHLVPGTAPASYLVTTGQLIDRALRAPTTAGGVGAACALVVRDEVLHRSRLDPGPARVDVARHVVFARRLGRYGSAGFVQARWSWLDEDPFDDRAAVEEAYGTDLYTVFSIPLMLLLTGIGPWVAGWAGWVALLIFLLQPAMASLGTPFRVGPSSLVVELMLRWVDTLARWLRALVQRPRRLLDEDAAPLRAMYAEELAGGTERFFEAPAMSCPVCAASQLREHLVLQDIWQGKPGRFRLDGCESCGHIFQNPRLSIDGLGFYYRDFYDGLGEDGIDSMFDAQVHAYDARAALAISQVAPRSWLDVGCGHGHFANVIKGLLPDAQVDGLDLSDGVNDAKRRGFIDAAHLGLFPELAPSLAGQYDVVSMSHYLEHTREQRDEIAAAATALRPGGVLLVEVPDPSSWLGRRLGRFWLPWFQPQHQHFIQHDALQAMMREEGLQPVASHRAEAHIASEAILGTVAVLSMLSPTPEHPWHPAPGLGRRVWHSVVWGLGTPLMLLAVVVDKVSAGVLARSGASNAYRIVARKPDAP